MNERTRSVELSSLTDIEHSSLQREEDLPPFRPIERFEGLGSVVLEEDGFLSFEREPGVSVVVGGRRRVGGGEASWDGREDERVDQVERWEGEEEGDDGGGEEGGGHSWCSSRRKGREEEMMIVEREGKVESLLVSLSFPSSPFLLHSTTSSDSHVQPSELYPSFLSLDATSIVSNKIFLLCNHGERRGRELEMLSRASRSPFPSLLPFPPPFPWDLPSRTRPAARSSSFRIKESNIKTI